LLRTLPPMLATLHDEVIRDAGSHVERSFDGIRLLVSRSGNHAVLYTRNGTLSNKHFPELVAALVAQRCGRFVLDGEVVAFDGRRTSFARLQQRAGIADPDAARNSGIAIHFYVFDAPWCHGYDLRRVPLRRRKAVVRDLLDYSGCLHFSAHRNEDGAGLLEQARRKGWEGIIAKRADSCYRGGRSKPWLKIRHQAGQELVIGGFTDPEGARTGFGALLVGYYEGDALRYAGRVGTGFDTDELARLHRQLTAIECDTPPFADPPDAPGMHWVTPERVAAIAFTEWTADGKLRHPVYQGERDDKDPRDVVREVAGA